MEQKQEILESRKRLDNALSLPDLVNEDFIAFLVKEHYTLKNEESAERFVESRTLEVVNFLEMLRSASGASSSNLKLSKDWKVKQDTDQLRVMYCEGPHGSPFHTLLVEGFADGPMDACLCVSWESTLYKKWWPQYNVPSFKIIASSCLQKVGIGEEISLIRIKCPWPVSDREAVLHYFEIEYFKEDLVLVLIKTISDSHGFSEYGIRLDKDIIQMDLMGGFVLQKVESNRCYFRAIFNFDIKLEFIPPWLINFISRQLVGNGHKLYQKAVGSVATTDEDYRLALQGSLYDHVRQNLLTDSRPATYLKALHKEKLAFSFGDERKSRASSKNVIKAITSAPEITGKDEELRVDGEGKSHITDGSSGNLVRASVSPEVELALNILDEAISIVRGQSILSKKRSKPSLVGEDLPALEVLAMANLYNEMDFPKTRNMIKFSKSEDSLQADEHRQNNINSSIIEEAGNTQMPQMVESITNFDSNLPPKSSDIMKQPPTLNSISKVCDEDSLKTNGFHNNAGSFNSKSIKKKRKFNLCCFT